MSTFRISTRDDYERAFEVVRRVIHQWDPYSLLAGGATADEFDAEVAQIVCAGSAHPYTRRCD